MQVEAGSPLQVHTRRSGLAPVLLVCGLPAAIRYAKHTKALAFALMHSARHTALETHRGLYQLS